MLPPGIVGVLPSHAITSRDSLGAGCLTISQEYHKCSQSSLDATCLEVGPRESRAGSRVPRYTSSGPTVPATCQGGAVHVPVAPPGWEPPPTHQWKNHAPCWLTTLPRSGYARTHTESAMLRTGDKQLRVAPATSTSGSPELNVRPHCNASLVVPREGAGHGGCARVTPRRTPPSQAPRA